MLQNNLLISERFYECEICHESVTNPICPICLTGQINIWSTNYPNLRKELLPKLNKYLKKFNSEKQAVQCIKCREKRIFICSYCFIKHVIDELQEIEVSKIIKKEFLQFFNYNSNNKLNNPLKI